MVAHENEYDGWQRQYQLQGRKAQSLAPSWPHLQFGTPVQITNQAVKRMNIISPSSGLKFKGGQVT